MNLELDLERIGIQSGDTVLVHSSFKSIGHVEGGMETLANAFMNVLGKHGTLLVPTLSYKYVSAENPVFDVRRTASNVGAFTNYVRQLPSACRSLSPTHSVAAIGYNAREMTEGQLGDNTPVGAHSPFRKLAESGGKVLFLGCGTLCNTMMHGVEELTCPEYLFLDGFFPFTVVDESGTAHDILCRRHKFHTHEADYIQRYDRVVDMLTESEKSNNLIGQADSWLIDAKAAWTKADKALRKDPLCLVDIVKKDVTQ